MKELIEIQSRLNVPKNQHNNFGNYDYRSVEDINEAVKPLLNELKCTLTLSDRIENVGNHNYIHAIATLTNEKGDIAYADGWAREAEEQKGMSSSQITGSTSSYARKYALGGLFLLDDTRDDDSRTTTATKRATSTLETSKPSGKTRECIKCGGVSYYKEGQTKSGKPYRGYFCGNQECKHAEWLETETLTF